MATSSPWTDYISYIQNMWNYWLQSAPQYSPYPSPNLAFGDWNWASVLANPYNAYWRPPTRATGFYTGLGGTSGGTGLPEDGSGTGGTGDTGGDLTRPQSARYGPYGGKLRSRTFGSHSILYPKRRKKQRTLRTGPHAGQISHMGGKGNSNNPAEYVGAQGAIGGSYGNWSFG